MSDKFEKVKALEIAASSLVIRELNAVVHEPAGLTPDNDLVANYVRFQCRVGDIFVIGTNHENTQEQMAEVLGFAQILKNRGVKTLFIEQSGDSAKDDLDQWLDNKGYKVKSKVADTELVMLATTAREAGINVVNVDLANNPSAYAYAIREFGIQRVVRAINSELSLKTNPLTSDELLDADKIPEIIKNLFNENGTSISTPEIIQIIESQDQYPNDFFTDEERERYMSTQISGNKYALAAHTAHVTAILAKNLESTVASDLKITIDHEKIKRVAAVGY